MELYDFLHNMIPLIILHKKSKVSRKLFICWQLHLYTFMHRIMRWVN